MIRHVMALTCALTTAVGLAFHAQGAVIYNYVGNSFDTISDGLPIDTDDRISGFVEFATLPTPGETNKTDVAAFSLAVSTDVGPLTISSTTPGVVSDFSFDFDDQLEIVNWGALAFDDSILTLLLTCNAPGVTLTLGFVDCTPDQVVDIALFVVVGASNTDSPGIWRKDAVQVPAPGTLLLFAVGIAGIVATRRRPVRDRQCPRRRLSGRRPFRLSVASPSSRLTGIMRA